MARARTLRLGLIGGNITASRSPALHIVCGLSVGLNVSYDLLIPAEHGLSFRDMLLRCQRLGFDGVNVTYPYKEEVVRLALPGSPAVAALGAANTVTFAGAGARATNTDHTGFIAAYRAKWGDAPPGRVLIIGTGGVGRAIAFALAELGAAELLLHDTEGGKAVALRDALQAHAAARVTVAAKGQLDDLSGLDGLVNGTPWGMDGKLGSPLRDEVAGRLRWAFDAIYTPEHTLFRAQAERLGAEFLSGYELYFHQGIQAFTLFSGLAVEDPDWVRRTLSGRG